MKNKKMVKKFKNKYKLSIYHLISKGYLEFIRFKENNPYKFHTPVILTGNRYYKYTLAN